MKRLFKLFGSPSSQYAAEQEIRDEQYLDKDGRVHIDTYLSFYDRELSMESVANETEFADNIIALFYSVPSSNNERNWEKAHGPARYEGGLQSFEVKPGTKRIGIRAFSYNINLKDISLPEGLEIIDREAFSVCFSLLTIIIPSSVRYIGKDAFDNKLERIILLCTTPPEISTLGIDKKCEIIVPKGTQDVYQHSPHWKKYSKQIRELTLS